MEKFSQVLCDAVGKDKNCVREASKKRILWICSRQVIDVKMIN